MPLISFNATMRKTRSQLSRNGPSNENENISQKNIKKKSVPVVNAENENGLKRKSEEQVTSVTNKVKRAAFGDITNAIDNFSRNVAKDGKKLSSKTSNENGIKTKSLKKPLVQALPKNFPSLKDSEADSANDETVPPPSLPPVQIDPERIVVPTEIPEDVENYDEGVSGDLWAVSPYAMGIFQYYKDRESKFPVKKYLQNQPDINKAMRAILVDWMVEIQESFELNHETLYLAVKIVDLFLSKKTISRDRLQLVGSTSIFVACKFDERQPPCVDDFLYVCNDAYNRSEMLRMEIDILKTLDFDLGAPLSYRFLRRYSRCSKLCMETLTFARYILESSLLDYELIEVDGSLLAAAALFLALYVKEERKQWSPTLQFYSGFKFEDIYHFVHLLHQMLLQPPKEHLKTVRSKYSHTAFFRVARIPVPEKLDI